MTELPASVTPPNVAASAEVATVPLIVVVLAVLVTPPLNVIVSPPLPSATPPVLENVTAFVIVEPLPVRLTA